MILPKLLNALRTLTWAVYLGCSWTWCIGMFLPVILVSEFGNPAWFVFAIPNVIGAAAMGWTLAKPGSSERMLAEHREACVAFSAVTLAFQAFFLFWFVSLHILPIAWAIESIVIGSVCGFAARWIKGLDLVGGWAVLALSLCTFAKGLAHPVFGITDPLNRAPFSQAMLGLAFVCFFGFLLCPYLDVTFHRARQQTTPNAGKFAFGFGFGVVFLAMIVLTLMYAGDMGPKAHENGRTGSFGVPLLLTWVLYHIATQIGYKFTVHLRLPKPRPVDAIIWLLAAAMAGAAIHAVFQDQWFTVKQLGIQMLSGELMYLLFMGFYALVFPSYVWMFIVSPRGKVPRNAKTLATWLASVVLAAPLLWLGFIDLKMLCLIPCVMLPITARLLVTQKTQTRHRVNIL